MLAWRINSCCTFSEGAIEAIAKAPAGLRFTPSLTTGKPVLVLLCRCTLRCSKDLCRGGRLAPILTIKGKAHGHKGADGLLRPVTVNSLTCKFSLQVYLFVDIMEFLCHEKPSTPP